MPKQKDSGKKAAKRIFVSQSEFPNISLSKALRIAQALWDNFAGKSAEPHQIALAIEVSPTSGGWRNLCGSSIAYGLTEGGYGAAEIKLTALGRRIVAPELEGDDSIAKCEAILTPRIQREFFQKYDKAKFPKDNIACNILTSLGLPKDRTESALSILKENGEHTGIIIETKTGPFVAVSGNGGRPIQETVENPTESDSLPHQVEQPEQVPDDNTAKRDPGVSSTQHQNKRVFITHGKNTKIMSQVEELVKFGKFEPIVAAKRESTSKPVPQKVLDDMRSCFAGVIHVCSEGTWLDEEGNKVSRINENVLIEIGAAMALYQGNFILLVEEGLKLPSNLQGLYECRYSGDELKMEATMKLLKTFNEFK